MSQITTHVLDTSRGRPANGLPVALEKQEENGDWKLMWHGKTDYEGRVRDVLPFDGPEFGTGAYRLTFDTATYFSSLNQPSFYPYIAVVFQLDDQSQHYHVPLLLSPFGYSTYRGS